MSKAKRTIQDLVKHAYMLSNEIENSISEVILKNERASKIVAVNIVQLVSTVDEIFNRIYHRLKGFRIKQNEILDSIKDLGVSIEFLEAFRKMKYLRNSIVHQINFVDPLYRYLSRDLKGLAHSQKMKNRMRIIVNCANEEAYYVS